MHRPAGREAAGGRAQRRHRERRQPGDEKTPALHQGGQHAGRLGLRKVIERGDEGQGEAAAQAGAADERPGQRRRRRPERHAGKAHRLHRQRGVQPRPAVGAARGQGRQRERRGGLRDGHGHHQVAALRDAPALRLHGRSQPRHHRRIAAVDQPERRDQQPGARPAHQRAGQRAIAPRRRRLGQVAPGRGEGAGTASQARAA
ncbi:hypothetical protein L494_1150, partial [Bordetella bronchiseptica CA90 BB1334]